MSESREIVPTRTLVKQGTTGVGGLAGGAVLLILKALGGPVAWIIGGILTLGGLAVSAASKEDRLAGGVVAAAGVLTILSGLGLGIGGALLTLGGISLLAVGGIGLYKFIRGLRSRR
jgi:hypothetical protein